MWGTGLSYQAVYYMLCKPWRVKRLDPATLERLCPLFRCQPGDLIGFDPERPCRPRAHTVKVNPLTADFRREWLMTFAERLRAGQDAKLDRYSLPSERGLTEMDDELDDEAGVESDAAEWVPPWQRGVPAVEPHTPDFSPAYRQKGLTDDWT
jgi:hypothetical protein